MSDFLNETFEARTWADQVIQQNSKSIFGKLVKGVIWSDARGEDGELLIATDAHELVVKINSIPHMLLHNHDPGKPIGQILKSAYFETPNGNHFVAAVLGYYAGGNTLNFRALGLDTKALVPAPTTLPILPSEVWIEFATDPREVDAQWLEHVTNDAPLRVRRTELSHNSADSAQELIRIGLIFLAVVWSPFVTSVASAAGKGTYAAIHGWFRKLLEKLADRRNPVLDVHTYHDGCQVSFLFRGRDVKQHYLAHDALSNAAAQAAQLVAKLKASNMPARQLVYEFDKEAGRWYPSYVILNDNRIIADHGVLMAIEQLPTSLSLGLSHGQPKTPVIK